MTKGEKMMSHEYYFEGVSVKKISIIVVCVFSLMIIFDMFLGHAQDNVTKNPRSTSEILIEKGNWPTQLVVDTVTGCYGGTIRWLVMANPTLVGKRPPPDIQRMMLIHCSCILDKIRVQYTFIEYFARISNPANRDWISTYFMTKAIECVRDHHTLGGLIKLDDLPDNQTTTKPEELKDTKPEEPLPKQPTEEAKDEEPNTLFQG
jgi:hypothetical protein